MRTASGLALAVLVLSSAACASEPKSYGATTAGPTKTSLPSSAPVEAPPSSRTPSKPPRTNASLCSLFTTAEINEVLGLDVARAIESKHGPYVVCTWKAKEEPEVPAWRRSDPVSQWDDGVVSITRGQAKDYADLARKVTALAEKKKAMGRQDLTWMGGGAFAIGASVSGVPLWHAVATHDGLVTAVEVSGATSKSSVATVSDFLLLTMERS